MTVGEDALYYEGAFGWSHADIGTVDKIPVFDANYYLNELYYRQDTMQLEMFLERVLFRGVRASEIGNSTIKVVTPYTSVLFDTVESGLDILVVSVDGDPLNFKSNVGNTIPIYFDPPDRVLGSRNTQTDLKYYVEEVPWEAQDAEQGASYGCR